MFRPSMSVEQFNPIPLGREPFVENFQQLSVDRLKPIRVEGEGFVVKSQQIMIKQQRVTSDLLAMERYAEVSVEQKTKNLDPLIKDIFSRYALSNPSSCLASIRANYVELASEMKRMSLEISKYMEEATKQISEEKGRENVFKMGTFSSISPLFEEPLPEFISEGQRKLDLVVEKLQKCQEIFTRTLVDADKYMGASGVGLGILGNLDAGNFSEKTGLSAPIWGNILQFLEPKDRGSIALTCKEGESNVRWFSMVCFMPYANHEKLYEVLPVFELAMPPSPDNGVLWSAKDVEQWKLWSERVLTKIKNKSLPFSVYLNKEEREILRGISNLAERGVLPSPKELFQYFSTYENEIFVSAASIISQNSDEVEKTSIEQKVELSQKFIDSAEFSKKIVIPSRDGFIFIPRQIRDRTDLVEIVFTGPNQVSGLSRDIPVFKNLERLVWDLPPKEFFGQILPFAPRLKHLICQKVCIPHFSFFATRPSFSITLMKDRFCPALFTDEKLTLQLQESFGMPKAPVISANFETIQKGHQIFLINLFYPFDQYEKALVNLVERLRHQLCSSSSLTEEEKEDLNKRFPNEIAYDVTALKEFFGFFKERFLPQ